MRICVPAATPEDWKRLLADPEKHWRTGYSARALAHCWQETNGFPPEVAQIFKTADDSALRSVEPLLILPEYKVSLPGKGYASQNDIFVLGKSSEGSLVSIMVEGKVNEPFGELMGEWRTTRQSSDLAADARSSANKQDRLAGLCERVGLSGISDTIY